MTVSPSSRLLASRPAPNDVQGFGRLNLDDIVSSTPARQYVNEPGPLTSSGSRWSRSYKVDDPSKPVKIVLAWSDLPYGTTDDTDESTTQPLSILVNDLNLRVFVGDGVACSAYYGNNLEIIDSNRGEESTRYTCNGNTDTKNTAEKIVFFPNVANVSQFTVVVDASRLSAGDSCNCTSQNFSIFAYNAAALPGNVLAAPASVWTSNPTTTSRTINWNTVQGSDHYDVYRGPTTTSLTKLNLSDINATNYPDTTLVPSRFYVYSVCPVDQTGTRGNCANLLVSTNTDPNATFTDEPLGSSTPIKALHVTELRQRINAFRTSAGMAMASFTNSVAPGQTIMALDFQELRDALSAALTFVGLPSLTFTYPNPTPGQVIMQATSRTSALRSSKRRPHRVWLMTAMMAARCEDTVRSAS